MNEVEDMNGSWRNKHVGPQKKWKKRCKQNCRLNVLVSGLLADFSPTIVRRSLFANPPDSIRIRIA